ncbi:MAG: chemotaxis response regulator protein-glutamate methylesterase [Firmicutes bacterium]|nr:chemotaxis response regulator protein-glutamate methylesterase [Bacillota bacterium]
MEARKKIRVLVVDDSVVAREVIAKGLAEDARIEVVAKAMDAFDARDKILAFRPDVMTCDIEMPKMDGIEFIRRLLPQYPLPVIVVSSISYAVFDALNAGAVDFVAKPNLGSPEELDNFLRQLREKVKIAAEAKPAFLLPAGSRRIKERKDFARDLIIAIGASTGGTEAIYQLLKGLPPTVPGIIIVQHIPPVFSRMFAERLNQQLPFTVKEAAEGDYVEAGKVLIAPGDHHLRVNKVGNRYQVNLDRHGEKVCGHRPSVDVLFSSVAQAAGDRAIGIILTGMGYDGAKGLLAMKRKGARTIGQDEQTSVVYGMPKVAFELGAVDKQLPLQQIPRTLLSMIGR